MAKLAVAPMPPGVQPACGCEACRVPPATCGRRDRLPGERIYPAGACTTLVVAVPKHAILANAERVELAIRRDDRRVVVAARGRADAQRGETRENRGAQMLSLRAVAQLPKGVGAEDNHACARAAGRDESAPALTRHATRGEVAAVAPVISDLPPHHKGGPQQPQLTSRLGLPSCELRPAHEGVRARRHTAVVHAVLKSRASRSCLLDRSTPRAPAARAVAAEQVREREAQCRGLDRIGDPGGEGTRALVVHPAPIHQIHHRADLGRCAPLPECVRDRATTPSDCCLTQDLEQVEPCFHVGIPGEQGAHQAQRVGTRVPVAPQRIGACGDAQESERVRADAVSPLGESRGDERELATRFGRVCTPATHAQAEAEREHVERCNPARPDPQPPLTQKHKGPAHSNAPPLAARSTLGGTSYPPIPQSRKREAGPVRGGAEHEAAALRQHVQVLFPRRPGRRHHAACESVRRQQHPLVLAPSLLDEAVGPEAPCAVEQLLAPSGH